MMALPAGMVLLAGALRAGPRQRGGPVLLPRMIRQDVGALREGRARAAGWALRRGSVEQDGMTSQTRRVTRDGTAPWESPAPAVAKDTTRPVTVSDRLGKCVRKAGTALRTGMARRDGMALLHKSVQLGAFVLRDRLDPLESPSRQSGRVARTGMATDVAGPVAPEPLAGSRVARVPAHELTAGAMR